MKIRDMFVKPIDRKIRGVIAVEDNNIDFIRQELDEFIITTEIRRCFHTFYEAYIASFDKPTSQVGVWISGFYGSGKSHFLKILSFLLSNPEIDGKRAIEYFRDKFDDPLWFDENIEKGANNGQTEVILFDIASVKIGNDDTFTRVIAKQFYEHQGLAGGNLKAAKLEKFLIKNGKYESFKNDFASLSDMSWEEARDSMSFYEDYIETALVKTGLFSQTAASNWFNGEEKDDISIDELTDQIRDYLDSKGRDARLLFMIDEVVQYIGDNGKLMLDLQTLVEQLGTKCQGKAWVIVTGQEDIDSFTHSVKGDFSKITGRFDTRIKLSSSSVDEVVEQRLLTKKKDAGLLLSNVYENKAAVLKNLFVFTSDTVKDLKGYDSSEQFERLYPLIPYQLRLEQEALEKIRREGMVGRSHSDGARSMIPSCQKAILSVSESDENALVPFPPSSIPCMAIWKDRFKESSTAVPKPLRDV